MITQKLIESIMAAATKNQQVITSAYIYDKLKEAENITEGMKKLNMQIVEENSRHQHTIKDIKTKIVHLQQTCYHWTQTYYADPSGNNDSYYQCEICGKHI